MDMNEQGKRAHRCCFTGHRPEKLTITEAEALLRLESAIRQAISDGYTEFITGMARGVDIWAGEIVIRLRDEGRPIKLICASPFSGFGRNDTIGCSKKLTAWNISVRDIAGTAFSSAMNGLSTTPPE